MDGQWVNREADAPAGRRQMRQVTQPLLAVAGLSKTFPVASRGAGWSLSRIASTRLWTLPIASWFFATAAWPLTRRSGNSTTLSWFG